MDIARSEGRISRWKELLTELTPPEIRVLQAYYQIKPWGEERADLREAVMAASVASAVSMQPTTKDRFIQRVTALANYYGGGDEEKFQTPAQAAMQMKSAFPSRSK